ncbi:ORF22 [Ovine gammaherpesvirus 2]|uniref:ORF22 n=1 Tax=Ovine gammaherpesvirus 2 TaxID=10398 RepID=Q2VSL8_9GAMA|nr:ORF22 [Ovine gammaherpesvirus 2]AAX58058.1 ORF22 [Ovine gammaherpesvirus 2]
MPSVPHAPLLWISHNPPAPGGLLLCFFTILSLWNNATGQRRPTISEHYAPSSALVITLDGTFYSAQFRWEDIEKIIRRPIIQDLWKWSKTEEPLKTTYETYKDIYKFPGKSIKVPDGHQIGMCQPYNTTRQVDFWKGITTATVGDRYDGDLGIFKNQLRQELFFYISNVFPPSHETHGAFYPVRRHMIYTSLSLDNGRYQLAGVATINYVSLVVAYQVSSVVTHSATIIFGDRLKLPSMRGSVSRGEISLVYNNAEELLLLTSNTDYAYFSQNLFPKNWSEVFTMITTNTADQLAVLLQTSMVDMARKDRCRNIHINSQFLTTYLAVLSLYYKIGMEMRYRSDFPVSLQCILPKLYETDVCLDMVHRCYVDQYTRGFVTNGLHRLSAAILAATPFYPEQGLEVTPDWFLQNLYYVDSKSDLQDKGMHGISLILMDIYSRYVERFTLTNDDRKALFMVYNALRGRKPTNSTMSDKYTSLTYCYTTSMCSAAELAWGIDFWGHESTHNVYHSFSPCFMSLRFDYSLEKLNIEGSHDVNLTKSQLSNGVSAMYSLLRSDTSNWAIQYLPIKTCITDASKVKMIVPFVDTTFVIAVGAAAKGVTYDVSETFLKSKMVVTVVNNSNCNEAYVSREALKIPVVYNMSYPKLTCQLCDSAVVSYDEYDGLQTLVYISNHRVQQDVFAPDSLFFDFDNMHTHYLLLMNNGTLLEIRGLYTNRAMNAIIFILFAVAAIAGSFIVYKIVMYNLSKKESLK